MYNSGPQESFFCSLSTWKYHHCLIRNDDRIARLELEVFGGSPAEHNFVIASRQSLHTRGAFCKPKNDHLISSRDRGESAGDGNSLQQCRFAFEWIPSRLRDLSKHENIGTIDLLQTHGDDRVLNVFLQFIRHFLSQLRGRFPYSHDVTNDRHGDPAIRAHLNNLR